MTFKGFLITYVLGGLTFIPLLLAAVLVPAWLLLPKIADDVRSDEVIGEKERSVDGGGKRRKSGTEDENLAIPEAAAEATFAVLRTYDFQAANGALNARNTSGNTAGGVTGTTDGEVDENETGKSSVYQSVYRSVFATGRTGTTAINNSKEVLENEEADLGTGAAARRKSTPANVFYIVLRHGHLMLYDSAAQIDVRHVISLAHHTVTLSEGTSSDDDEARMKDADLFIKRTAIVLTPTNLPNGHLQSRASPPKPFYLFSTLCSEKEDFYHALLYTRASPPIPEPLEPNDAIKLQSALHSTSLTPETRAFNALVGRVFLGIYHTPWLENLIQTKVEKKISRVQKPSFLANLKVQSIDLGDAAPILSNPRLKDLNISGEMTIAFDIRYSGGIKLTIAALAKLDLGQRFKTRTVDLVLATSLSRLQGHMLVRIKPSPTNRIWFCFESPPDMDVRVEPVVSQRKISYTFITRAIEDRIRAVVTETLVKPNWDDVPFFNTLDQKVRGGIWRDEGDVDGTQPKQHELLQKNAKTKSMPILPLGADHDSSAGSSGSESTSKFATGASTPAKDLATELKRRSVASLPPRSATNLSTSPALAASPEPGSSPGLPPSRPLRSPSFTSPSLSQPSVALDEASANRDAQRTGDTQDQPRRWRMRPAAPPLPARKEAVEAMREMRDRVLAHREGAEAEATRADILEGMGTYVEEPGEAASTSDPKAEDSGSRRSSDSHATSLRTTMRSGTTDSTMSTTSGRTPQQRQKTMLAATTAATNAARNWSWNALANARAKGSPNAQRAASSTNGSSPQQQPMGRGQPLPPPGQPLPGPQKGLFSGLGTVRRKPITKVAPDLPARRAQTSSDDRQKSDIDVSVHDLRDEQAGESYTATSDEFGPWRENSGMEDGHEDAGSSEHTESMTGNSIAGDDSTGASGNPSAANKPRPPLPPRRGTATRPEASSNADVIDFDTSNDNAKTQDDANDDDQPTSLELKSAEEILHSSDVPVTLTEGQAEAKFALGADIHEDDFEHDGVTSKHLDDHASERERPASQYSNNSSLVAIPAPVEDDEDMDLEVEDNKSGVDTSITSGSREHGPETEVPPL